MPSPIFRVLALAAAALSLQGHAADLQLPSVPVGQILQVEFTLSTTGGAPIPGVDVSLLVPDGCGQVVPDRLATDSAGKGRFDFLAGSRPGVCTITGASGGAALSARTTIFRPEELVVGGIVLIDDVFWRPGVAQYFTPTFTAGGLPLQFVPIGLGQFAPGGPTVVGGTQLTTDASGAATVNVVEGSAPGIHDLPLHVAGVTRHLRLRQGTLPEQRLQLPYKQWVQGSADPAVVILPDGAAGACAMGGAFRSLVEQLGITPQGAVEFFNDPIELRLQCTGPTTRVRIEYPDPIPADGQVWLYGYVPATGWHFRQLSADVAGNAVTFTIPEFLDAGGGSVQATVGVGLPGTAPAPRPLRVHDMWWGGGTENGWGMSIVQKAGFPVVTFAALFAYDDAGEPTWWAMTLGDWATGRVQQFTAPAYSPVGSPWFAHEPRITYVGEPAGRVQLRFSDAGNGEMDFTLHGRTGRKAIQRLMFGPPASAQRPDVGGVWWGGQEQSGWGISVLQQGDKLFNVWYTYDSANKPTWFFMPDGRWSSATTYEGRVYRTRGSPWLNATYDASQLRVTDVGEFTMTFGAQDATFAYTIEGRTSSMRIVRNPSY